MAEEFIRVLYNARHGQYNISQEAFEEFNKRVEKKYEYIDDLNYGIKNRTNDIILKVYDLLGSERFSGEYANIRDKKIKAEYKDFIRIKEYDGHEIVNVNLHDYKIYSILKSEEMSEVEKIKELKIYYGLEPNDKGEIKKCNYGEVYFDDN